MTVGEKRFQGRVMDLPRHEVRDTANTPEDFNRLNAMAASIKS
jgi:hypothetical protein